MGWTSRQKKNQSVLKMARRKRIGTRLKNIGEALLGDVEDKAEKAIESFIGKRTADQLEGLLPGPGPIRKRPRPAGILAMMAAEPSMAMEGAMDPIDRQLALGGHGVQQYEEAFNLFPTTSRALGVWVQLNLAKHQALLVQRIRMTLNVVPPANPHMALGLRWGRPAGAIGTGAPGHLSPGQQFTWPDPSGATDGISRCLDISDIGFMWGSVGGDYTQEINLAPNFALIRSYCVVIGTASGANATFPHINLYGKIVNLNFTNILTVKN